MSKWSEIYSRQIEKAGSIAAFSSQRIGYKAPLLEVVERYSPNRVTLEIGCGSGLTTSHLALRGYDASGIDSDLDMIHFAQQLSSQMGSLARFWLDDLKTLEGARNAFDVIYSHGVMEHFSDKEIVAIVDRHLVAASHVIISIPSDHFNEVDRIYGDERFMNVAQWRDIIACSNGEVVEEFCFDSEPTASRKPQFIGFVLRLQSK